MADLFGQTNPSPSIQAQADEEYKALVRERNKLYYQLKQAYDKQGYSPSWLGKAYQDAQKKVQRHYKFDAADLEPDERRGKKAFIMDNVQSAQSNAQVSQGNAQVSQSNANSSASLSPEIQSKFNALVEERNQLTRSGGDRNRLDAIERQIDYYQQHYPSLEAAPAYEGSPSTPTQQAAAPQGDARKGSKENPWRTNEEIANGDAKAGDYVVSAKSAGGVRQLNVGDIKWVKDRYGSSTQQSAAQQPQATEQPSEQQPTNEAADTLNDADATDDFEDSTEDSLIDPRVDQLKEIYPAYYTIIKSACGKAGITGDAVDSIISEIIAIGRNVSMEQMSRKDGIKAIRQIEKDNGIKDISGDGTDAGLLDVAIRLANNKGYKLLEKYGKQPQHTSQSKLPHTHSWSSSLQQKYGY